MNGRSSKWPWHGWLGLALVAVFWTLNWSLSGLRTHWGFFPLWLGYCLTVDALAAWRRGTSLFLRSRREYLALFLTSAPAWWLFELLNKRTGNWEYLGAEAFSDLQYALLCTLSFSTVIPAVFGTAELFLGFRWVQRAANGPRVPVSDRSVRWLFVSGWLLLSLLLLWPRYFFPVLWLCVFLVLEPVNWWLGHATLLSDLKRGDWRLVVSLSLGCLMCGFFWELWNYYSYPKWVYHVPFVDFWHVFEMPLLGYLGYVPFSWELFAFYHLVRGWLGRTGAVVARDWKPASVA